VARTCYPFVVLFGKESKDPNDPKLELHEFFGDDQNGACAAVRTLSPEAVVQFLQSKWLDLQDGVRAGSGCRV